MKVILFHSVDNLGSAGEVVNVKNGYFRNYLGPRGYARPVTKSNLALMESQRKKINARVERELTIAEVAERAGISRGLVHRIEHGDMGCSVGAVKVRVHRAMNQLRETYHDLLQEAES